MSRKRISNALNRLFVVVLASILVFCNMSVQIVLAEEVVVSEAVVSEAAPEAEEEVDASTASMAEPASENSEIEDAPVTSGQDSDLVDIPSDSSTSSDSSTPSDSSTSSDSSASSDSSISDSSNVGLSNSGSSSSDSSDTYSSSSDMATSALSAETGSSMEDAVYTYNEEFTGSQVVNGVNVSVRADIGVFPDECSLSVSSIGKDEQNEVESVVEEERSNDVNVAVSYTFDIKVLDKDGNEIQPDTEKGQVKVLFEVAEVDNENLEADIYHISDEEGKDLTAEKLGSEIEKEDGKSIVVAETTGFSYYTVEFTYDNKTYSIAGDSYVLLSSIMDKIGLSGTIEKAKSKAPDLFETGKFNKEGREYKNSNQGNWYVHPVKAFDSVEKMDITMDDGIVYSITVTDDMVQSTNGNLKYDNALDKDASTLVKGILSSGMTATNENRSGTVYTFTDGADDVGMNSGIILDTSGKNNSNASNDADLAKLVTNMGNAYGGHTSSLEFSMKATGTLLNFNYSFASSEFDQSSTFNDTFGLFVSINGGDYENIALIERDNGTKVPVTIVNLRAGLSGTELGSGSSTSISEASTYSLFRAMTSSKLKINECSPMINGVSILFNAKKQVNIGDDVKVKFAICDDGDTGYDSFVFIQAESLSFDAPGAKIDYDADKMYGLVSDSKYAISCEGEVYLMTSSSEGVIPLSGEDDNSKAYDFFNKSISIVKKSTEEGQADSDPQVINVGAAKKNAVITIPIGQSAVYSSKAVSGGTSDADILYSYSGDGNTEVKWYSDNNGTAGSELGSLPVNAGTYWIGVSASSGTNYKPISEVKVSFEIRKRPLTITAKDQTIIYGESITEGVNQITAATLQGTDIISNITLSSRISAKTISPSSAVILNGNRDVTGNYDIAYKEGIITIQKAEQLSPAAPTDKSKTSVSIVLNDIVTAGYGALQYAYNTTDIAPVDGWQESTSFTDLVKNTKYYFFARYSGDENHKASPASTAAEIKTLNVYTISYDFNGGSGTDIETSTQDEGSSFIVANRGDFSRAGYTFSGWAKDCTAKVPDYSEGATAIGISTDATLYAVWTAHTYTVSFKANDGIGTMENQEFTYGDIEKALDQNVYTKKGCFFAGWALSSEAEVAEYADKQKVSNLTTDDNGNVTFYAIWRAIPVYQISGTVIEDSERIPVIPGAVVRLMKGNAAVAQATTASDGTYSLPGVYAGEYNLIVSKNNKKTTILVKLTDSNQTKNVLMPKGSLSYDVEVKENTPSITVDNLDKAVNDYAPGNGGVEDTAIVKITMVVESKDEMDVPSGEINAIKGLSGSRTLTYLGIDLEHYINYVIQDNITDTGSSVIEIYLPFDTAGKENISIYRYHDDDANAFTRLDSRPENDFQDATYYVGDGFITIYASKFSTYAVGYTLVKTDSESGTQLGGSSGESSGDSTDISTVSSLSSADKLYSVTVDNGIPVGSVKAGTLVTLAAQGYSEDYTSAVKDGLKFSHWEIVKGNIVIADITKPVTTFIMPAGDVEVRAIYGDAIAVQSEGTNTTNHDASVSDSIDNEKIGSPDTGDNTDVSLIMMILLCAVAVLSLEIIRIRKRII